ncbi:hypothetical protein C8F01DRAFT_1078096 [Mycena amicta]|nr:hypothetical protein C8F01DRAFT_1078096 [Mycena amicta]
MQVRIDNGVGQTQIGATGFTNVRTARDSVSIPSTSSWRDVSVASFGRQRLRATLTILTGRLEGLKVVHVHISEEHQSSHLFWSPSAPIYKGRNPALLSKKMDPQSSSTSSSSSILTGSLPIYSPSLPSPCYSLDPAHDETILDVSPYHRSPRPLPTGIFTKPCGSATVVLLNQQVGVRVPSYGRRGSVRGTLMLDPESTSAVSQVTVKLQGRLEITTSDAGASTSKMITVVSTIWPPAGSSSPRVCPESINFECQFPESFRQGDYEHPLPPSYIARFPGFPSLYAKATYNLAISIVKDRRLGFIPKTKTLYIPLDYVPESSPPRGITYTPCADFLSVIKYMPEEWYQSSFTMKTRCNSNFLPLECQVFIPSVRIFGIEDTIPVHIQLSGSLVSLRNLISPCSDRPPSPTTPNTDSSSSPVRVYLTRMVSADHLGKLTWRVQRIGANGRVQPLPPTVDFDCTCSLESAACDDCATSVVVLDWAGEVRCDPKQVEVGGFHIGSLSVKDFLTVQLTPPNPRSSPLIAVQHAIPIRFVTESYREAS